MSKKQTTDMERWELIGKQIRRVAAEQMALSRLLSGNVPKTVWNDQHNRMVNAETKIRSDLEDRMAGEHPETWEIETFYGGDDDPEATDVYDEVDDRVTEAEGALPTELRVAVVEAVEEHGPAESYEFDVPVSEKLDRRVEQHEVMKVLIRGEERGIFEKESGTPLGTWRLGAEAEWR